MAPLLSLGTVCPPGLAQSLCDSAYSPVLQPYSVSMGQDAGWNMHESEHSVSHNSFEPLAILIVNRYYGSIVGASYTALVDIILAIFPTTFITKLNISRKMKVGLCFLMGGSVL